MSYSFEIILSGAFPADDPNTLQTIQNRLSLHTDACQILHRHDLEFHLAPTVQYNMGSLALPQMPAVDVSSLYLKHDLVKQRDGSRGAWALHTHLKPIKAHTRAMVRPATKADISTGDPLAFASAMGYVFHSHSVRRGFTYCKGPITISLYQFEEYQLQGYPQGVPPPPPPTDPPSKPNSSSWHIEILQFHMINSSMLPISQPKLQPPPATLGNFSVPSGAAPPGPAAGLNIPITNILEGKVNDVLGYAALMKGLVDVRPENFP